MPGKMGLIDTHCHLCHAQLRRNMPAVLGRSRQAGVAAVICAGADLQESNQATALAGQEPDVYCTAGVHPHEAKTAASDYLAQIERLAGEKKNVAVGEMGLDYHYNLSPPADQRKVFAEQLELAKKLAKPVVVHSREAFDDTLSILAESGVDCSRVVFHSFTEDLGGLRRALKLGAMIGFSGIVTFKNASQLREVARDVPDDKLLIETDAPYLSPEPVRKIKINEPANVSYVAACIASVRGTPPERLADLTAANAIRLFGLKLDAVQPESGP
ncbi:MAG: TatD family hydrolase [Planctomycetota bacterium]|nr:TatD family hydrolase [Planctomycetota bacterium]